MTTSQTSVFLTEMSEEKPIPAGKLAYFRTRLRYALHEIVLNEFLGQKATGKTNKAHLAKRIGRKPEQVSRWLGAPGNWTIDTLSDLCLAMNSELSFTLICHSGREAPR